MFLTDQEMGILRTSVETQTGYHQELIAACSHLIHISAFDEAVRNAFVVLEERMRKALDKKGATGMQMAQYAFSPNGPFTKILASNQAEFEGTRDLFYGAFRLYRNPSAHTIVNYTAGDARSIISLVNLLLTRISQLESIPQPGTFPENIEDVLRILESKIGFASLSNVRVFLTKCVRLNMHPSAKAKTWIPFRKHALVKNGSDKPAKAQPVTVFYVSTSSKEQGFWFPIHQYYSRIVGLETEPYLRKLQELGFQPIGQVQDPYITLDRHHSDGFLNSLYGLVVQIGSDFEGTLKKAAK